MWIALSAGRRPDSSANHPCEAITMIRELIRGSTKRETPFLFEVLMRKVFLVATLLVGIASSPMPSHAQKSRVGAGYFKRANQRYAKGDIEGAIADFGIAIMADSSFAMAYNNRGVA